MSTTGSDGASVAMQERRPRVVVGIDGSPGARAALRTALVEAAARGADLEVVSAYPVVLPWTAGVPDLQQMRADARTRARAFLDEVRAELMVDGGPDPGAGAVRLVVQGGPPAPVLVERAAGADLLVVGSRGRRAVRSLLLGSVALHCVTHASCPVLVAHGDPGGAADHGRHVAVGLDGSDAALAALREGVAGARRRRTDLDVLVAYEVADYWTDPHACVGPSAEELRGRVRDEAERLVATVTAEVAGAGEVLPGVHVHLVEGVAQEVLVDRTADAAMLVVGSRGRGAFRGLLLGSVALSCVMHAHCPVTVVHPADHPAPGARAAEPASARA
jgi:nucleotide-binding universal stress UspA family protein